MNERIKQLAEQAGIITEVWKTDSLGHGYKVPNYEAEKFAELIVKECARVARATPCPYEEGEVRQRLGHTWDMASSAAGREITEHFGVEA
jgi:hypothetical protein